MADTPTEGLVIDSELGTGYAATYDGVEAARHEFLGNLAIGHFEVWRDVITLDVIDEFGREVSQFKLPLGTAPGTILSLRYALEIGLIPNVAALLEDQGEEYLAKAEAIIDNVVNRANDRSDWELEDLNRELIQSALDGEQAKRLLEEVQDRLFTSSPPATKLNEIEALLTAWDEAKS